MMVRLQYKATYGFEKMKKAMEAAELRVMQDVKREIMANLRVVVGTQYETLEQMRAKGHPYGRGARRNKRTGRFQSRGKPAAPKDFINRQSGRFYAGFEVRITKSAGKISLTLYQADAERNSWLTSGTSKMVARRFGRKLAIGIPEAFEDAIVREMGKVIAIRRTR